MRICVPKEIYPKIVVLKAAYQYTDRAYIYIQQTSEDYLIDMKPKDGSNQIDLFPVERREQRSIKVKSQSAALSDVRL